MAPLTTSERVGRARHQDEEEGGHHEAGDERGPRHQRVGGPVAEPAGHHRRGSRPAPATTAGSTPRAPTTCAVIVYSSGVPRLWLSATYCSEKSWREQGPSMATAATTAPASDEPDVAAARPAGAGPVAAPRPTARVTTPSTAPTQAEGDAPLCRGRGSLRRLVARSVGSTEVDPVGVLGDVGLRVCLTRMRSLANVSPCEAALEHHRDAGLEQLGRVALVDDRHRRRRWPR